MLIILLFQASSVVLGIDYGSEYIKVAIVSRDAGVHILPNFGNTRKWRNQIAIWNLSNPSSPIQNNLDFEGLTWELFDAAQAHIDRYPTHGFRGIFPLFDTVFGFRARELLALQLRALILSIDERPFQSKRIEIIFAVFPLTPIPQRLAIAESIKLANATLITIIESHTAVAHLYAREKSQVFSNGMKDILFIDIGASHTWMAVFRFEPNGKHPIVTELAFAVNETLGGKLIDNQLCQLFLSKSSFSNNETCKTYPRLLEEVRKAKELLTVDESVTVMLEDVSITITREEFVSLLSDFNNSLSNLYATIIQQLTTEIHFVEVIGGTSRVPFLKDVIHNLCGGRVRWTLNGDEAVALGAAYVGAMSKGKLPKVRIDRSLHCVIRLLQRKGNLSLFNEGSKSKDKTRKTFTVGKMEFDYTITADDVNMTAFHVEVPETARREDTVQFTFGLNRIGAPVLQKVEMQRNQSANVTFSPPSWLLNTKQFQESLQVMKELRIVNEDRQKIGKLKSDMEQFLSEMSTRIHNDELFLAVMNETERKRVIDALAEAESWYDSIRTCYVPVHEFVEKFRSLKAVTYDHEVKCQILQTRRSALDALNATLITVYTDLTGKWGSKTAEISTDRVKQLWERYNQTKAWIDANSEIVLSNSDINEPTVFSAHLDKMRLELEDFHKFAAKTTSAGSDAEVADDL
jgi:molecular chaperone DnaK (HSP70)